MPDSSPALTLHLHGAIAEIPAAEWDACADGANPFVSHAFLAAVEASGSAGPRTGWLPRHAALRDEAGTLVAAAPQYTQRPPSRANMARRVRGIPARYGTRT